MNTSILKINQQDETCYRMACNKYSALFCPGFGANMLELIDTHNNLSLLNFDDTKDMSYIKDNIILYGWPILYLPNRFHKGILKTSDNTYSLPINEPEFDNFIHGFIHKRAFTVTQTICYIDSCSITAEYYYDKNDEFYKYLPIDFKLVITYSLSDNGLEQTIFMTNLSQKVLPVIIGCHTAINLPFDMSSNKNDLRIKLDVDQKLSLNKNICSIGDFQKLSYYDLEYQSGNVNPLTEVIDNEMFKLNDNCKYNGVDIYDIKTKHGIRYTADNKYKYWLLWNNNSNKGICCTEPMTAMINASQIDKCSDITGYIELQPSGIWTAKQLIMSY